MIFGCHLDRRDRLARKQGRRLFRVTVRSPADLNAVEDLVELDLDLFELARKVPLVAASLLRVAGQKHREHGRHAQVAQVVNPRRCSIDDVLVDAESALDVERRLLGLGVQGVDCERDVRQAAGGAGGWPTFKSLCSRRSVIDVSRTESIASSTPLPGILALGLREPDDLVGR